MGILRISYGLCTKDNDRVSKKKKKERIKERVGAGKT